MINDTRDLCTFLAERDVPCPNCRYSLRGLNAAFCPECKAPIVLRVAADDQHGWVFLVGLVGWSLGAGFSLITLVHYLMIALFSGYGFGDPKDFLWAFRSLFWGTLIQGGVIVVLLIWNGRVRSWPFIWQAGLALLGYVFSLGNAIFFLTGIR
jgi:hypothetical protein